MKNILLLAFLISSAVTAPAQVNRCTVPIANNFFEQRLAQISGTYDLNKYTLARTLAQNNCLSSLQVKQVALKLNDDYDKLEFCKLAYINTVDKDNFYDVYDAFAYFSTVFRLHDHIRSLRPDGNPNTPPPPPVNSDFPLLPYPDAGRYLGITNCNNPLEETQFLGYAREIRYNRMAEQGKLEQMKTIVTGNCLTTAQVMKLATILSSENYRYDLLSAAWPRVYDRGNFMYAQSVLSSQSYKDALQRLIIGNSETVPPPVINCTVSQQDIDAIKKAINDASFANSKVTVGKQAIEGKKCFTVAQIKELIVLYSFDDNKLDMAKFAYDFCTDKSNYYQVNEVFAFSSSKEALSAYIASKR